MPSRQPCDSGARRLKGLIRERDALELRLAGLSFQKIGDQLGVSKKAAEKAVKRAMAKYRDEISTQVAELRTESLARLERLRQSVWTKAIKGDLEYIDRAVKIEERTSKLLGLDMPTKIAPTTPAGDEPAPIQIGGKVEVVTYRLPDNGRDPQKAPPPQESAQEAPASPQGEA